MLQSGTVVAGSYRVVQHLGSGGMGAVYEVTDHDGATLALKRMDPRFMHKEDLRKRFEQEAQIGAALKSPHIVEVRDWGIDPEFGPYLVMERLSGENLETYVTRVGRLSRHEARRILSQIGEALERAHSVGVVHRDLKPGNIFLAGTDRTVKLLDFGIAKLVGPDGTDAANSMVIGTRCWMAPEQLELQRTIDPRTDVWAFGLLAFYVLTGMLFWRAAPTQHAAIIREVCDLPVPAASVRAADLGVADTLPNGFDDWLSYCLARDPGGRFERAGAAMTALLPMLRVSLAHPTPTPPPVDPAEEKIAATIKVLRDRIPAAILAMKNVAGAAGPAPMPTPQGPPQPAPRQGHHDPRVHQHTPQPQQHGAYQHHAPHHQAHDPRILHPDPHARQAGPHHTALVPMRGMPPAAQPPPAPPASRPSSSSSTTVALLVLAWAAIAFLILLAIFVIGSIGRTPDEVPWMPLQARFDGVRLCTAAGVAARDGG